MLKRSAIALLLISTLFQIGCSPQTYADPVVPSSAGNIIETIDSEAFDLDAKYYNNIFDFEVDYPSHLHIEEDVYVNEGAYTSPDNGVKIFFDEDNYIYIYGAAYMVSAQGLYNPTEEEFITNDGISGTFYDSLSPDNRIEQIYIINKHYAALVHIEPDSYGQYSEMIDKIVKSIRIPKGNTDLGMLQKTYHLPWIISYI